MVENIKTEKDLQIASDALASQCAHMRKALKICGYPPLRLRPNGLEGLVHIIISQQLSVASAKAISERVDLLLDSKWHCQKLTTISDDDFRACGLSKPKIRTMRAIVEAIETGTLDINQIDVMSEHDIMQKLTAIKGIGPWTAQIYLIFSLGKCNVFAYGDLALQISTQNLLQLEERPTILEMEEIAEQWYPYKSIAARLLWLWYRVEKQSSSGFPI